MNIFRVLSREYRDSLFLMKVSADVSRWPGVKQAVIVMGTESNRRILQQLGLNSEETDLAGANDLVIAIELENQSNSSDIIGKLDTLISKSKHDEKAKDRIPDLTTVLSEDPEINLVAISTPGDVALSMAREAINAGKHVFCFSHHISVESEIELKDLAIQKKLLMMGPDCGTSIIDGVGLGFANKVRKGSIGIVSASGSGLQEVISLIHRSGAGISQAIGVGGRDLTSPIDGRMAEQALLRIANLPQTEVILLLAKKVSTGAEQRLLNTISRIGKPIVTQLPGLKHVTEQSEGNNSPVIAETFEECAKYAVLLSGGKWLIPDSSDHSTKWLEEILTSLDPERRYIRGLYAGGSLCGEANQILTSCGFTVSSNLVKPIEEIGNSHLLLDLGAEEYTEGMAHPFIDHRLRDLEIEKAFSDPKVGILLVDVVLGWGCHPDPAAELIHSLEKARKKYGSGPVIITSVCGTSDDFQNYDNQRGKLTDFGIFVAESNAAAARLARDIVILRHLNKIMATDKPKFDEAIIHDRLNIVNVGLPVFVEGAEEAGAKVVPARWSPLPILSEDIKSLLDGLL